MDVEDYKQVFSISGRVIVTGDFNAHNPLWKSDQMDRRGECIEGMLDDYGLTMLNTGLPTYQKAHGGSSVLDLSFASGSIANGCEWTVSNDTLGSDHVPTFIEICQSPEMDFHNDRTWKLKSANWPKFQKLLSESNKSLFDTDTNKYNKNLTETIIQSAKQSVPVASRGKANNTKAVPYWNNACSKSIYERNKARNKFNKNKTLENKIQYKKNKAIAQRILKVEQTNYWQNYCSSINKNTKLGKVWQMSKRMGGRQSSCFKVPTLKNDKGVLLTNATKADALA